MLRSGVDSTRLTPAQREKLAEAALRHRRFIEQLVARMQQLHFPGDDQVYSSAVDALAAAKRFTEAIERLPAWRKAIGER